MVGVKQFDDETVAQSALELFRQKGYFATSMLDLSQATGVHRGSLYNAYGGKDEIFLIAFEAYAQHSLKLIREALAKPDLHTALTDLFEVIITNMCEGSPARGCLTTRTVTEGDTAGKEIQERLQKWLKEVEEVIKSALSVPKLKKKLTLPVQDAAELLITFTRGLAVMERTHHDASRLRANALVLTRLMIKP